MESEITIDVPRETSRSKSYDIEVETVTVTWKEFAPEGEALMEEPGKKTGIIFNTGWSLPSQGRADPLYVKSSRISPESQHMQLILEVISQLHLNRMEQKR